jgi:hypothetical protein
VYRAVAAATLAALTSTAAAQDHEADRRARRAKTAVATRTHGRVAVDGRLDDATWTGAVWQSDFHQKEPRQDAAPKARTEVAIAFDDDALYVAARMEITEPELLDRPLTRRDETGQAERFIVSLDPYRSRRTAYSFAVTAAGVRADWIHTDDDEFARDHSWNPVWDAAVDVHGGEWTCELRIPWSQLRFPREATPVWGIDFNRYVPYRREDLFWIVVPKDVTAWASYFGELRGLEVTPKLRLEVLPYVTGAVHLRSGELFADDDPFADTVDPDLEAGVDLKYGLGPGLTVDATINPDFGQVEQDPAAVQLDAYEVTFEEKRPFFVEGAQIFASQPRTYFYSRRIGAPPRIEPDAAFVDTPATARILGAAKLTGQVAPRTNIGALAALTAPVEVQATDGAGEPVRSVEVAPLAMWGVMRLERELDEDASVAGLTFTGVSRDTSDPGIKAALPRAAISGGADLKLRFDGGRTEVYGNAGGSAVAGSPSAIEAIQRSPAHYFQRPDADHVEVDPTRTVLTGWHADLGGGRRAGAWRVSGEVGAESPGLELNDVGVLQDVDGVLAEATVERVDTTPSEHLHSWSVTATEEEAWNFGGTHTWSNTGLNGVAVLPSFTQLSASTNLVRPTYGDELSRGGPLVERGWDVGAGVGIETNSAKRVSVGGDVGIEWSPPNQAGARGVGGGFGMTIRASDRVTLNINPLGRLFTIGQQYVTAVDGTTGGAETYGTRYVFAALSYREAILRLRAQISLSPELTIDGVGEAFASSGRYHDLGELPRPRARERRFYDDVARGDGAMTITDGGDTFTIRDPDFTYMSLRSTLVLRWELRPGSVLYAVWQQSRERGDPGYRRLGGSVLGDVASAPGEQVLAVKLSYWWSP